jgi:integrase
VRRLARKAGINKPVGPHTLRHAFITAVFSRGGGGTRVRRLVRGLLSWRLAALRAGCSVRDMCVRRAQRIRGGAPGPCHLKRVGPIESRHPSGVA